MRFALLGLYLLGLYCLPWADAASGKRLDAYDLWVHTLRRVHTQLGDTTVLPPQDANSNAWHGGLYELALPSCVRNAIDRSEPVFSCDTALHLASRINSDVTPMCQRVFVDHKGADWFPDLYEAWERRSSADHLCTDASSGELVVCPEDKRKAKALVEQAQKVKEGGLPNVGACFAVASLRFDAFDPITWNFLSLVLPRVSPDTSLHFYLLQSVASALMSLRLSRNVEVLEAVYPVQLVAFVLGKHAGMSCSLEAATLLDMCVEIQGGMVPQVESLRNNLNKHIDGRIRSPKPPEDFGVGWSNLGEPWGDRWPESMLTPPPTPGEKPHSWSREASVRTSIFGSGMWIREGEFVGDTPPLYHWADVFRRYNLSTMTRRLQGYANDPEWKGRTLWMHFSGDSRVRGLMYTLISSLTRLNNIEKGPLEMRLANPHHSGCWSRVCSGGRHVRYGLSFKDCIHRFYGDRRNDPKWRYGEFSLTPLTPDQEVSLPWTEHVRTRVINEYSCMFEVGFVYRGENNKEDNMPKFRFTFDFRSFMKYSSILDPGYDSLIFNSTGFRPDVFVLGPSHEMYRLPLLTPRVFKSEPQDETNPVLRQFNATVDIPGRVLGLAKDGLDTLLTRMRHWHKNVSPKTKIVFLEPSTVLESLRLPDSGMSNAISSWMSFYIRHQAWFGEDSDPTSLQCGTLDESTMMPMEDQSVSSGATVRDMFGKACALSVSPTEMPEGMWFLPIPLMDVSFPCPEGSFLLDDMHWHTALQAAVLDLVVEMVFDY